MCKCCQHCLESCYWHLIEKRFCFDESIALYKDPLGKQEKNNNVFENMAFYDSVSVIAGRAIVTIDPLPEKSEPVVIQQPKRLNWEVQFTDDDIPIDEKTIPPATVEKSGDESNDSQEKMIKDKDTFQAINKRLTMKKSVSFDNVLTRTKLELDEDISKSSTTLKKPDVESRKKSLIERRMSKSLYLKIDYPKELPIIRQNSVPKFFLDTPEQNQTESTLIKSPLTSLQSPMVGTEHSFDLYSVVQMEKIKTQTVKKDSPKIHRSASRLSQIKGKIKLRKTKSTVSSSNIPHSNYM